MPQPSQQVLRATATTVASQAISQETVQNQPRAVDRMVGHTVDRMVDRMVGRRTVGRHMVDRHLRRATTVGSQVTFRGIARNQARAARARLSQRMSATSVDRRDIGQETARRQEAAVRQRQRRAAREIAISVGSPGISQETARAPKEWRTQANKGLY